MRRHRPRHVLSGLFVNERAFVASDTRSGDTRSEYDKHENKEFDDDWLDLSDGGSAVLDLTRARLARARDLLRVE